MKKVQKAAVRYDEKFCEEIVAFCSQGFSVEMFALHIGCSRAAIYQWMKEYPEFDIAAKDAKTARQKSALERVIKYANGQMPRNGSVAAAIFICKNLGLRDDVIDVEQDNSNTVTLKYNLTDPDAKKD